jgi:hypothetical protein
LLTALTPNVGLTANETVTVKVYNFSPVAVSNVPVSYKIKEQLLMKLSLDLLILSEVTIILLKKADHSAPGLYTVGKCYL